MVVYQPPKLMRKTATIFDNKIAIEKHLNEKTFSIFILEYTIWNLID